MDKHDLFLISFGIDRHFGLKITEKHTLGVAIDYGFFLHSIYYYLI